VRAGHRLATPEMAMQETAEEGDLHLLLLEATPEAETPGLHLEAIPEVETPGHHLEATPEVETLGPRLEATLETVATADQYLAELTQASVGLTLEVGQPLAAAMATLAVAGLALEQATIGQDLVDPTPASTTEDLLLVAILPDPATLEGQVLAAIQERVRAMELAATADNSVATITAEDQDLEVIPEEGQPDSEGLAMVHQEGGLATMEQEQAGTDVSSAGSRARFRRDPVATVRSLQSAHRSSTVPRYSKSSRVPTTTSSAPEVTGASMTPSVPRYARGPASSGTRRNATSSTSATTTSGSRSTPSMSSLVQLSWGTTVTSLPATGPSKDPLLNALNNIQPLAVTPFIHY